MAIYVLGDHTLDLREPDRETLVALLKDETVNEELFHAADCVKTREFGNKVFIRGIIEFSNHCRCTCAYCGINARMTRIKRYRMLPDDLVDAAVHAAQTYRTVIL